MRAKAAVVAVVLLAGAGCDGINAVRDARERAPDFEQRTVETGRVEITVLPSEDGAELPKALQMKIDAEITEGGDRIGLVVDAGDVRGGDPNGPEAEMILVEDDLYLRLLAGKDHLPRGKSWIRMDTDEAERMIPEFEGITRFADTKEVLSTSSLPEDDATGTETIDGVETTRYELSAGLDEMDEVVGMPKDLLEELQGATGGDELNMTAWLDEEGFMRRLRFPMKAAYLVPRLEDEDDVVMQFEVTDLGEDISVELPPDKEVLSL